MENDDASIAIVAVLIIGIVAFLGLMLLVLIPLVTQSNTAGTAMYNAGLPMSQDRANSIITLEQIFDAIPAVGVLLLCITGLIVAWKRRTGVV